jgi:hypothetical protein
MTNYHISVLLYLKKEDSYEKKEAFPSFLAG